VSNNLFIDSKTKSNNEYNEIDLWSLELLALFLLFRVFYSSLGWLVIRSLW